jgi:hypothetical protein
MSNARLLANLVPDGLDDYEQGTYTATLGYGPNNITSVTGNYTKIGELVRVDFNFANVTAVSGQTPYVSGLPFAQASTNPTSSVWSKSFFPSADTIHTIVFSSSTTVQFRKDDSFANATMNGATGTYLVGTLIYRTDS